MARSCRVLERLNRAAASQHEGIGDELERREIDVGLSRRGEFDEAAVKAGIFGIGAVDQLFIPCSQPRSARGQDDRTTISVEMDVPALRAGLAEIEFGVDWQSLGIAERKRGSDRRVAVGGGKGEP